MPTLFAVYNLKENQKTEEYDNYLRETKIPGVRGAPWRTDFRTWKIDKVLGSAVTEPQGELPVEPPYRYIAKFEISDLDAMMQFFNSEAGREFAGTWSVFIDPASIFTSGQEI